MDNKHLIEAALFMAAKPLSLEELQNIVKLSPEEVQKLLDDMKGHYDAHGLRVVEHETDGKKFYELHVKEELTQKVGHLAPAKDFSRGTLQTLSLIAYKAPIKQSELIKIRGNRGYEHVAELEERGFIRREPKGHTKVIHITRKFLEYFGLSNLKDLQDRFESAVEASKRDPEAKA